MNKILTPAEFEAELWKTFMDAVAKENAELPPSEWEIKVWEILAEATMGKRIKLTRNEQGEIVKQEEQT